MPYFVDRQSKQKVIKKHKVENFHEKGAKTPIHIGSHLRPSSYWIQKLPWYHFGSLACYRRFQCRKHVALL